MKILQKALKLSYDRFKPNPFQRRYHYAIAFDGNKPICLSQNNPIKINAKALRMGERFNIPTYKEYPFNHAESHLISKLLDRYNSIDSNWTLVVLRINRKGLVMMSKPCENCDKILKAVGLTEVYWSVKDNIFMNNDQDTIAIDKETFSKYSMI